MTNTTLLKDLTKNYHDIQFLSGDSYLWSPKEKAVYYQSDDSTEVGKWTLLHETCHGLLSHTNYKSDFELVKLEVEAWEKADELAESLNINIDQEHVQDCLDSYRDWQYKRSICPKCELGGVQTDQKTYTCLFCNGTWRVSAARFCRPYRRQAVK